MVLWGGVRRYSRPMRSTSSAKNAVSSTSRTTWAFCGRSELTMGQTVIDWWGASDRPQNAHVVREVDDAAFFALLVERIGRL